MGLYQLLPIVQATRCLHFVLHLIGQSGEKVDARDAFHVVDGLHVIAFRAVVPFVAIDKTDSFWLTFHTQHHLKERLWNSYLILSDGFMFAFHHHRARNDVDAAILFSPFSALSFQLFPIANVQLWSCGQMLVSRNDCFCAIASQELSAEGQRCPRS